jgi:hypothetical protein
MDARAYRGRDVFELARVIRTSVEIQHRKTGVARCNRATNLARGRPASGPGVEDLVSGRLVSATSLPPQPTATTLVPTLTHRLSPQLLARSYGTLWQRRRRLDGVDGKAITRVDALDQPRSLRSSKLVLHRYELAYLRQLVSFVAKCPVDPVRGRRHEQDGERPQLAHATEIHPRLINSSHSMI